MDDQDRRVRDSQVLELLRFYYGCFAIEEKITPEQDADVLAAYFFGWLFGHMKHDDAVVACQKAGVPASTAQLVREMLQSGVALEKLGGAWFSVALCRRPAPQRKVKYITITTMIVYDDDTFTPICHNMPSPPAVTDGILASMLQQVSTATVRHVASQSVDKLYDVGFHPRELCGDYDDDHDPYNYYMGLTARAILNPDGRTVKSDPRSQVVSWYFRTTQHMLRPVLPPAAQKRLQQMQKEEAKASVKTETPPSGGWDD